MPHIVPGIYTASPIAAGLRMTKSGKEEINVLFRIKENGAEVKWRGYFTEKSMERTLESLRACGWEGEDISGIAFPEGVTVQVTVEDEEWEKEDGSKMVHSRVAWVNATRGPSIQNQMDPAAAAAFAARMRGAIVAFDQKHPKKPKSDLPF